MVLAVLGIGVLVATGRLLPFQGASTDDVRAATAVVIRTADCGVAGARDRVEVQLDAEFLEADLVACGHTEGARLEVDVIEADLESDEEIEVWLAGTATGGPDPGERMSAVLLAVAGLAGAALAVLIGRPRRRSSRPAAAGAVAPAPAASGATTPDPGVPDPTEVDPTGAHPTGSEPAAAYGAAAYDTPGDDPAGYAAAGHEPAGYGTGTYGPAVPDLGVSDLYASDSSTTGRLPVLDQSVPPLTRQPEP
ncbi:hypothetical protein UA75_04910 [Actinoalloteichus sp. GBA129-24]|uniref:Uncharacterized protein n=2 Tax=Pseudonocardiaceae TaxID=2070 RepID=A0AAC9L7Y5_9PSEU|nr:hypothetical protein UA74_04795 [Actinoalloteichus fjordicus]APU19011.1 hypothetical protein UA75_04910 [Actinoalloteichus sp. GBA129-24]